MKGRFAFLKQSVFVLSVLVIALFGLCACGGSSNNSAASSAVNSTTRSASQSSKVEPVEYADKDDVKALEKVIKKAKKIDAKDYTSDSYAALSDEIEYAESLAKDPYALKSAVESEKDRIKQAMSELVEKQKPVSFSGYGDDVVDVPEGYEISFVDAEYTGGGNFAVWSCNSDLDHVDLLINTIGAYKGRMPLALGNDTVKYVEVKSEGDWTISLMPLDYIEVLQNGAAMSGDDVVFIGADSSKLSIENHGESNFVVRGISSAGSVDLLVNEIGDYSGTVANRDYVALVVNSSGEWSVSW